MIPNLTDNAVIHYFGATTAPATELNGGRTVSSGALDVSDYQRVLILFRNTTTNAADVSIKQGTDSSLTGKKIVTVDRYWDRVDAAAATEIDSSADDVIHVLSSATDVTHMVELTADDLDADGGFTFIDYETDSDPGATAIVIAQAICYGARYAGKSRLPTP